MTKATYDDIVALPDSKIGEIVEGELYASPRPALRHAKIAVSLVVALGTRFSREQLGSKGWHILFEPEVHLGDEVFVPDLAGWRIERLASIPDTAWAETAPDWVCEILSPSTGHYDRGVKLPAYARHGVSYAWIVDPSSRRIETFVREGAEWRSTGSWPGNGEVAAPPFESVAIDLGAIWA
jgi:Uma2 family endonuclease